MINSPSNTLASFDDLPLRSRKAATARRALLEAVLVRLSTAPLDQISVRDCCAEVGVSEPTFFNYFGSKSGALVFFVHLWSIEAQWHLARSSRARAGVLELFERSATLARDTRWLLPEIITYQFRALAPEGAGQKPVPPPSKADKLLAFPQLAGVEQIEGRGIEQLIRDALHRARDQSEIDARVDLELVERLLLSLFFGAAASNPDPAVVADTMARGLSIIWPVPHSSEIT